MKHFLILTVVFFLIAVTRLSAQKENLYIDVHHLQPGKVSFADVAAAHAKDLAVQRKYHMHFLKYWVDEKNGDVYCLSSARDTNSIVQTHGKAHGLLPKEIYKVNEGTAAAPTNGTYFIDVHTLGAGKVNATDVEQAHQKDLAIQNKYGVNFINYWVDETKGVVFCLSQANDSSDVVKTHREAHGLLPANIVAVKEGK